MTIFVTPCGIATPLGSIAALAREIRQQTVSLPAPCDADMIEMEAS